MKRNFSDSYDNEFGDFEEFTDSLDSPTYASSAWDCTGLIPSMPLSEAELEAYEDMYRFVQPALAEQRDEEE